MNYPIEKLEQAIKEASNWATTGWSMTFGSRNVAVNSLKEAQELKETFPNRPEAINYWVDVETVGKETASHGEKAKVALQNGEVATAINSIYFARYLEKRIRDNTPTWGPVYLALEEVS
ncbi:MAG: hypothetical protein HQL68_10850 [Magnetococcales bacterium]|nr:hypothetical protein [Magnetococcales bacterium]